MTVAVADCVLGETQDTLSCATRAENQQALVCLASQVRQAVAIYSRTLSPDLYGSADFVAAIRQMILGSRFASVRIVIVETGPLVQQRHRLLGLALNLSSFIQLRRAPERCRNDDHEYIILDETAWLHRDSSTRFESRLCFNDRFRCRTMLEKFNPLWEESVPDSNLRKLNI